MAGEAEQVRAETVRALGELVVEFSVLEDTMKDAILCFDQATHTDAVKPGRAASEVLEAFDEVVELSMTRSAQEPFTPLRERFREARLAHAEDEGLREEIREFDSVLEELGEDRHDLIHSAWYFSEIEAALPRTLRRLGRTRKGQPVVPFQMKVQDRSPDDVMAVVERVQEAKKMVTQVLVEEALPSSLGPR